MPRGGGGGGSVGGGSIGSDAAAAGGGAGRAAARPGVDAAAVEHVPQLTRRELSVLELVGEGMVNKEVAARLGIGLRYVEKVVTRLMEKTATTNRTALVRRALQLGYLALEPLNEVAPGEVLVTRPPEARGGRLPPSAAPFGRLPPGRPEGTTEGGA